MSEARVVHRPLYYYLFSVYLVAAVSLAASWYAYPPVWTWALPLLLAAVVVCENFALAFPSGQSISMAFPLMMAAVVLLGPTSAAIVGMGIAISVADFRARKPFSRTVYNMSSAVLFLLAAGWTYSLCGGQFLWSQTGAVVSLVPFTATTLLMRYCLCWPVRWWVRLAMSF